MELIKRKIILGGLTTSGNTIFPPDFVQPDYFIGVHLTQKYEDIGLYTDLEDNLDMSSIVDQLAKGIWRGQTQLISGMGNYVPTYYLVTDSEEEEEEPAPKESFITINSINEPDLASQINVGTELLITPPDNVYTVINIIGPDSSGIITYQINNFLPINDNQSVNIEVEEMVIEDVILSQYEGTVGTNGEIITTGTSSNFILDNFLTNQQYTITGETDSRLNEVKTFDLSDPFQVDKPQLNNNWVRNIGIEQGTNREFIEYTITQIDYKTYTDNGETTYSIPVPSNTTDIDMGWNTYNTTLLPSVKEEIKMGLVETPKIDSGGIFVDRKELSVFEPHLRLNEIIGIDHLEDYSRGYYNLEEG